MASDRLASNDRTSVALALGAAVLFGLSAPAGKTWDVAYTNDDDARHDFAVVPEAGFISDVLFMSEMVEAGDSATITVPALAAGTYDFVCSLHSASMRGARSTSTRRRATSSSSRASGISRRRRRSATST